MIDRTFIPPRHQGRMRAQELTLMAEAASEEDARLAIRDLYEKGYAMLKGGKRYEPPPVWVTRSHGIQPRPRRGRHY